MPHYLAFSPQSSYSPLPRYPKAMDKAQEPAWLRSYKSSAAPFSTTTSRTPGGVSTLPRLAEARDEVEIQKSRSEANVQDQDEPISVTFPSTISLGLHSFGRREDPVSPSVIHPALRATSVGPEGRTAPSHNSSMTKVEVGHEEPEFKPEFKDVEPRSETGWRQVLKRWISRLACNKV